MVFNYNLNPLMADKLWDICSVIWFSTLLVACGICFSSKNIHLWKFGKVAIFPGTAMVNFMLATVFLWYIAIPAMAFVTWLLHFAYKYQQKEIFNWEQNGGYALNNFRLKKQLKEFPNLPKEEQQKIIEKAPKSIDDLNISLLKMYLISFLPNVIISISIFFCLYMKW